MEIENLQNDKTSETPLKGFRYIKEAIILSGGFGTRLRDTVPDLPKCMAPVNERPFLYYVINYLRSQGIEKFIFSLGYKHEVIEEYLNTQFSTLNFQCLIEKEPLGTGGAILASCYKSSEQTVLVVNGDTLFKFDLDKASADHERFLSHCTLLLKPMKNFDRYGVVELNVDSTIKSFQEKQFYASGLINGGAYILNTEQFLGEEIPEKFSFEKDYLEKYFNSRRIYGSIQDKYFIDIGIPDDYYKAQQDLRQPSFDLKMLDKSWTVFIDRDGVINHEKEDDYIRNREEFHFYTGVKEAMKILSQRFGKIIVVSNQRGIGKGLMTVGDLENIHQFMKQEIKKGGGCIDGIYYCTAVDPKHPDRKPNPGMAFKAQKDFLEIDLSKSIMIGNKLSDMLFGKNAGMYSIYIASTHPETPFPHPDIDGRFDSLSEFARACNQAGMTL